ncbi:SDR family oxidoreductase [Streptomyces sp. RK31]|uniref:SDR family oxidoreductase n=1 Tax=Streptomyces sp. RK31 TaxID=2824892 RepID=UPI001B395825|nr:SDR family oxidoreductase [Streptomyces sp. RK31]MBQ0971514.1 SDR family oxidoreductase [Streptomyces sp. RK31]
MSDGPLGGRTAVVTGAARGIGAGLARELAARGMRVALLGHEGDRLRRLADDLPVPALAYEVDVTDDAALEQAADAVRTGLGTPSVVVANAAVADAGLFADSDPARWGRIVDVNLTGSANTARTFLPDLTATKGHYLQVASLAAIGAAPMMSAYCASKAGAEAFAHSLRAEVAHLGVTVGLGYLTWIRTDLIEDADRHGVMQELRGHMPWPVRDVYPPDRAAARLAQAVEHRSTAVYYPRWLRLAQPVRAALPAVVTRATRHYLPRIEARSSLAHTDLLGGGGTADAKAARPS